MNLQGKTKVANGECVVDGNEIKYNLYSEGQHKFIGIPAMHLLWQRNPETPLLMEIETMVRQTKLNP